MTLEALDILKIAALIAAFLLVNWRAIFVAAAYVIDEILFMSIDSEFAVCLSFAVLYSLTARININIPSQVRQALLCIAAVNWLTAVDSLLFAHETVLYMCYPWLINGLDVYILYCLLNHGGRQSVGLVDTFARAFNIWRVNL